MQQAWLYIGIAYLCLAFCISCFMLYRKTRTFLFRLSGILTGLASLLFACLALLSF